MSLPSNRRPWLLLIAALIVGGCVGSAEIGNSPYPDDGEWIEDDDGEALGVAESDYETRAALARDVAPDEGDPEAEGLIIAPEVMTGYVGETLLLAHHLRAQRRLSRRGRSATRAPTLFL